MTQIQVIQHKQKKYSNKPFATLHIKPDWASTEVVEKDLHFGLFVLGTEKHESRRIDNQLRGRSGRQGDAGASQFFVALDDEIMRKMGGDTIKSIAKRLLPAEELEKLELTQSQFTSSIRRAQVQMEWYNFSIRKHLFEYDNVVNKQRMKVYGTRDRILEWKSDDKAVILDEVAVMIHDIIESIVKQWHQAEQSFDELRETINQIFWYDIQDKLTLQAKAKESDYISWISALLIEERDARTHIIADDDKLIMIIRSLYLQSIDKYRIEHIDTMQHLREKVWLYGYAQQDPLVIYKQEAYKLYAELRNMIRLEFMSMLFKIDFTQFHGMEGAVDFGIIDTNEEDFQDNLIGEMDKAPSVLPARDSGVQVIDLTPTKNPLLSDKKVWANDPCPCGSGKKYKKCHGA
jgi:preprotein translocase subunit SecA